jgi:hypothetical protein
MGRPSGNLISYAPTRLNLFNRIHAEKTESSLIGTALTLSRPSGTQFGEWCSHADSKGRTYQEDSSTLRFGEFVQQQLGFGCQGVRAIGVPVIQGLLGLFQEGADLRGGDFLFR